MRNIIIITGILLLFIVGMAYILRQPGKQITITNQSEPQTTTQKASDAQTSSGEETYTLSDVSQHSTASSCWLVIEDNVYDVTTFIPDHPGGNEILKGCGKDATSMFQREREHQEENAASLLPEYKIGILRRE